MARRTVLFFCVFFIFRAPLRADDSGSQVYFDAAAFLNDLYGLDANAALGAFPLLGIPMGGQAEGMAGAAAAGTGDLTSVEWNPAVTAILDKTALAFFHNNWIADTKIESAAYTRRFGDIGAAVAGKWLWTPFTEYGDFGEHLSKGYYSEAALTLNVSYNFLRGYYFEGISAGLNIKALLRTVPDFAGESPALVAGSGSAQSAFALAGDIGFFTRINLFKLYAADEKNTAFALVVRNIGGDVAGDPLPLALAAAATYKPARFLTLALDLTAPLYATAASGLDFSLSEQPFLAFGVQADITTFLAAHAGIRLKSGGFRLSAGSEIRREAMIFYLNYTLDLLTQLQPANRITVGVRFDLGDGGRAEKRAKLHELYLEGVRAYAEGRDDDARLVWEEALTIDKKFDPAIESLRALDNFENLDTRVRALPENPVKPE
jgi:hypothetical protein